ncbi:hemolysin family protein [Paenibacillus sp. N3/727]|uniref:hemolysin family protein n=1 Tax=Paenibacillus sp. N3/727 TaxID=2925845 RepID=UPI001F5379F2|nr:hemolysin family protein [Paenibacillus sp. N3/727]UNK20934.1 hemolysin family protein [Paenibacillus sp. N3/727]
MSDPLPSWLGISLILFLVLLNGFFVSAELAFVKVRGSRIDALVEEGKKNARIAQRILRNLDAYLSACQLGITISSLLLGWIGERAIASMIAPWFQALGLGDTVLHVVSIVIAFAFIAVMHIVLGELAPKTVAVRKAETIIMLSARPMDIFYKISYPVIWLVNNLSSGLLRLFRMTPVVERGTAHTEEELRDLMKESSEIGLINDTELTLVDNIFEFADTTAREIMIPRTDMICLYSNLSMQENLEIAHEGMRTRYPICDEDKDHIIGFIHIKDLMRGYVRDQISLIRPIIAVPESMKISELLKRMQRSKTQIAILIDEYGGTSGLVTLEDIMEEIVGEIQDEFDEERQGIEIVSEDEYSIDGLMLINEINGHFGLDVDTEDYDTIGGWLSSRLEVILPHKGQTYSYGEYLFVVEETENKRISRITLLKQQVIQEEAGA